MGRNFIKTFYIRSSDLILNWIANISTSYLCQIKLLVEREAGKLYLKLKIARKIQEVFIIR